MEWRRWLVSHLLAGMLKTASRLPIIIPTQAIGASESSQVESSPDSQVPHSTSDCDVTSQLKSLSDFVRGRTIIVPMHIKDALLSTELF